MIFDLLGRKKRHVFILTTIHNQKFSKHIFLLLRQKLFLKGGNIFQERTQFFATNSNFLIRISLKPYGENLISNLGFFIVHRIHSLKCQRSAT